MQQDRPDAAVYRGRQKGSGSEIRENFLLHAILSFVSTTQNTTKTKETSGEVQKKKKEKKQTPMTWNFQEKPSCTSRTHRQVQLTRLQESEDSEEKKRKEEERNAEKKMAEPTREQQGGQTQNACKWLAPCVFSFKGIP